LEFVGFEIPHDIDCYLRVIPNVTQELVARTTKKPTHTLATRRFAGAALVVVVYLASLVTSTNPAEPAESLYKRLILLWG
jgi:hypothetical protein